MKNIFQKLFVRDTKPDVSDTCEVIPINEDPGHYASTQIETKVLETSKGEVVAQSKRCRGGPTPPYTFTQYGYLKEEIPWEESETGKAKPSPDPADYSVFFILDKYPSTVYVVKREKTEKGKRALSKILREECKEYDVINFF